MADFERPLVEAKSLLAMASGAQPARIQSELISVFGALRNTVQKLRCFGGPAPSGLTIAEAIDIVEAKHLGTFGGVSAVALCQVGRVRPLVSVQAASPIANPPTGLAETLEVRSGDELSRLESRAIVRDRGSPVVPLVRTSGLAN